MKSLELSLDLSRSVPFTCDLFNPALPAWNYQVIGGSQMHRNKLISSIFTGEILNNLKPQKLTTYINIFSISAQPDPEYLKIINLIGGKSFDLSKTGFNIFAYDPSVSPMSPTYLKILKKELQNQTSLTDELLVQAINEVFYADASESAILRQKYFPNSHPERFTKTYESTYPEQLIDYVANILLGFQPELTKKAIFYSLYEALTDYYQQNKEAPNYQAFLKFCQFYNIDTYNFLKSFPEGKQNWLSSSKPLNLSERGNYFYLTKHLDFFGISVAGFNELVKSVLYLRDRRKFIIIDGFGHETNKIEFQHLIEFLKTSRKNGTGVVVSNPDFYPELTGHTFGYFCLDLSTESTNRLSNAFPNFKNNHNYFKYDLGVQKEHQKTHVSYPSQVLEKMIQNKPSEAQQYLLHPTGKLESVKSRLLDGIVKMPVEQTKGFLTNTSSQAIIGLWSIKKQDLQPNDLVLLDQELSSFKCTEAFVILDQEIDEDELYVNYSYKQVKKKMTFVTLGQLQNQVASISHKENDKIFTLNNNTLTNCKVLYIDPSAVGLSRIEL
jgi:hypothetical protein